MGNSSGGAKLPPLPDTDMQTVLSYNLKEEHLRKFLARFRNLDLLFAGAWGVQELYTLISEPRLSMRAPIIDALFFMGDSGGEGSLQFPDFLVMMSSFCALTREEVLQLLFIILDVDRNGRIGKQELLNFFSYCPIGMGKSREPVFPVNNKNSLDKFQNGKWDHLQFDGFCQLCEHFPYISFPAFHTQELYRQALLGQRFWERFVLERGKASVGWKTRWVKLPGTRGKEEVEVRIPGRCTLQEMIDFSRRMTSVSLKKRVPSQTVNVAKSRFTLERDNQVAHCPIFNMIRNPLCMYHIPREITAKSAKQLKDEHKRSLLASQSATDTALVARGPPGVLQRRSSAEVLNSLDLGKYGQDPEEEEEEDESGSNSDDSYESEDEEEPQM